MQKCRIFRGFLDLASPAPAFPGIRTQWQTTLLSLNPPLWAPSIIIRFKPQLLFFPETLIVLDN